MPMADGVTLTAIGFFIGIFFVIFDNPKEKCNFAVLKVKVCPDDHP